MKAAEEKAKELVDKFMLRIILNIKQEIKVDTISASKQCAIFALEEKIELIKSLPISNLMKQDLVENELKIKQKINEL